jgi:hypothetical protein
LSKEAKETFDYKKRGIKGYDDDNDGIPNDRDPEPNIPNGALAVVIEVPQDADIESLINLKQDVVTNGAEALDRLQDFYKEALDPSNKYGAKLHTLADGSFKKIFGKENLKDKGKSDTHDAYSLEDKIAYGKEISWEALPPGLEGTPGKEYFIFWQAVLAQEDGADSAWASIGPKDNDFKVTDGMISFLDDQGLLNSNNKHVKGLLGIFDPIYQVGKWAFGAKETRKSEEPRAFDWGEAKVLTTVLWKKGGMGSGMLLYDNAEKGADGRCLEPVNIKRLCTLPSFKTDSPCYIDPNDWHKFAGIFSDLNENSPIYTRFGPKPADDEREISADASKEQAKPAALAGGDRGKKDDVGKKEDAPTNVLQDMLKNIGAPKKDEQQKDKEKPVSVTVEKVKGSGDAIYDKLETVKQTAGKDHTAEILTPQGAKDVQALLASFQGSWITLNRLEEMNLDWMKKLLASKLLLAELSKGKFIQDDKTKSVEGIKELAKKYHKKVRDMRQVLTNALYHAATDIRSGDGLLARDVKTAADNMGEIILSDEKIDEKIDEAAGKVSALASSSVNDDPSSKYAQAKTQIESLKTRLKGMEAEGDITKRLDAVAEDLHRIDALNKMEWLASVRNFTMEFGKAEVNFAGLGKSVVTSIEQDVTFIAEMHNWTYTLEAINLDLEDQMNVVADLIHSNDQKALTKEIIASIHDMIVGSY